MPKTFGPGLRPQRYVPYGKQAGACSLKVPLETHPNGQMLEGRFQVPAKLAKAEPDTNERLAYRKLRMDMYHRWIEWRAQQGWYVVDKTLVCSEPYPNPTANAQTEGDPETMTVSLFARFKRATPLWTPLDDVLEVERKYEVYGIEKPKDALPFNDVSGSEDSGWVDPLKFAEERRQKAGINLNEYRIPEWWKAEEEGERWQPKLPPQAS